MGLGRIGKISPLQIFQRLARPSNILNEPVPKVKDVLNLQEKAHQAELDAHLWCAKMKHERNLLEIILRGMNHV